MKIDDRFSFFIFLKKNKIWHRFSFLFFYVQKKIKIEHRFSFVIFHFSISKKIKIKHKFPFFIFLCLEKNENWKSIVDFYFSFLIKKKLNTDFHFSFFNLQKKWMTLIYTHFHRSGTLEMFLVSLLYDHICLRIDVFKMNYCLSILFII